MGKCFERCFGGKNTEKVHDPASGTEGIDVLQATPGATKTTGTHSPDTVIESKSAAIKDAPPVTAPFMSPVIQPPSFTSPGAALPAGSGGRAPKPAEPTVIRGAAAARVEAQLRRLRVSVQRPEHQTDSQPVQ